MQHLTREIAATYMGAAIKAKNDDGKFKALVNWLPGPRTIIDTEETPYRHYCYQDCQLILTLLSKVTDDDAEEIAKIINRSEIDKNLFFDASIVKRGYQVGAPRSGVLFIQEVVDYLRSEKKSNGIIKPIYDCGYKDIPSLITAGIGV